MQIYWDDLSPFDAFLSGKINEKELLCQWVRDIGRYLKSLGKKIKSDNIFIKLTKK